MAKAFLVDTSKCIGCRGCQVACKQWNGLQAEPSSFRGTYENPEDLSAWTWRKVKFLETVAQNGGPRWRFLSDACKHCGDSGCLAVCPTGALHRQPWGAVDLNDDACNGCRYCVAACPFGVITFNRVTGRANKCTMCPDRVTAGRDPACVATCPTGALIFGEREAVLARARRRMGELLHRGEASYLYGERELGGLNAIYVLQEPPAFYGLPAKPRFAGVSVFPGSLSSVAASVAMAVAALLAFRGRAGKGGR